MERKWVLCCDSGATKLSLQWCDVKNRNKTPRPLLLVLSNHSFFSSREDPYVVSFPVLRATLQIGLKMPFSALHHQNWELAAQHLFVTHHPIFQLEATIPVQLRWWPELPWKKRLDQHLSVSHIHTVIHSLFHDWSTPAYTSVLVIFLMQVFLSVLTHPSPSQTSLSSLSMMFVLNRDYCLITPSGIWLLLVFTLLPHGSNNETTITSKC